MQWKNILGRYQTAINVTIHEMYVCFAINIFDKKKLNESSFAFVYKPYSNAVQRSACYPEVKYDRFFRNI